MCQLKIEEGIIIDEVENVLIEIKNLSGRNIEDYEVIKKFITEEKATKFYIDERLNSYMVRESSAIYLWLDSGFRDDNGKPILIALHRSYDGFVGHYTGTAGKLISCMKNRHPKQKKHINDNANRFLNKYKSKTSERKIPFIDDINEYYLAKCNESDEEYESDIAIQLKDFEDILEDNTEDTVVVETQVVDLSSANDEAAIEPQEAVVNPEEEIIIDDLTDEEKDITIGLLLEQMKNMRGEINEMMRIINENQKDKETIATLRQTVEELSKSFTNIRLYDAEQQAEMRAREEARRNREGYEGHNLLGKNKKILIVGDCHISNDDIYGICKTFGFTKKDIEIETDYSKITNAGNSFLRSGRFDAIIFGKLPHKVAKMGDWSSCIESVRMDEFGPYPVDARTKAGELNVTKTSFKEALKEVCDYLAEKEEVAC